MAPPFVNAVFPGVARPLAASQSGISVACVSSYVILSIGVLFLGIMFGNLYAWETAPRVAVLEGISWTFSADVQEPMSVDGSSPPAVFGELLYVEERQRTTHSVLDHHEEPHCQLVQVPVRTLSHFVESCYQVWIEPEPYSASEHCEEKDIYKEIPGQPIYANVCTQEPVYVTTWRFEEQCSVEYIIHDGLVFDIYYSIERWRTVRHVYYDSTVDDTLGLHQMDSLRGEDERFANDVWAYYLYFDAGKTKKQVSARLFYQYKDRIGQEVEVP